MLIEMRKAGLYVESKVPIVVRYDGTVVGEYEADTIFERKVLLENKAVRNFDDGHISQCLNYLAATVLPVCLLINYGQQRVEVKQFRGPQKPAGIPFPPSVSISFSSVATILLLNSRHSCPS
jgi:GxxExxY protein